MRPLLRASLAAAAIVLFAAGLASAFPHQFPPSPAVAPTARLHETVTQDGPLTIGDREYTVLYYYQVLSGGAPRAAVSANSRSTLSRLEIVYSPQEPPVYQESFPYGVSQGRLQQNLAASASVVPGNGGSVLIIRFLDHTGESADGTSRLAKQWWRLFAVVNKEFTPLGLPLPLGQGTNITVNKAVAAVMTKGGIAVMPMASTAEVLALPAWTGNFYAQVPMRFDWTNHQWGEGEECYRTADGALAVRGCIMQLQVAPQQRSSDADIVPVQLFAAPDGDSDDADVMHGPVNVMVAPNTSVEFLEMQAVVQWRASGQYDKGVVYSFSDVWLRTRIDGQEGWVHGQDAFDALGLPLANPQ
jgi:hypothetical protein